MDDTIICHFHILRPNKHQFLPAQIVNKNKVNKLGIEWMTSPWLSNIAFIWLKMYFLEYYSMYMVERKPTIRKFLKKLKGEDDLLILSNFSHLNIYELFKDFS